MPKAKPNVKRHARSKAMRKLRRAAIWVLVLGGIGGLVYGLVTSSGVPYGERQLVAIDFSSLNEEQKDEVLVEANAGRCDCGCGMGLAQCVSTDMSCPIRQGNITRIRGMVQKVLNSGGGS
jgi:hypothetical protein